MKVKHEMIHVTMKVRSYYEHTLSLLSSKHATRKHFLSMLAVTIVVTTNFVLPSSCMFRVPASLVIPRPFRVGLIFGLVIGLRLGLLLIILKLGQDCNERILHHTCE